MNLTLQICQYFLGIQFLAFGLNGFLSLFPNPPPPDGISRFMTALEETKFILPSIKIIEIITGAMLLLNLHPQLALALLSPIVFNVIGLHLVFNFKKSWILGLQVLLPYSLLMIYSKFWSWLS
jgi:hypothetical protein